MNGSPQQRCGDNIYWHEGAGVRRAAASGVKYRRTRDGVQAVSGGRRSPAVHRPRAGPGPSLPCAALKSRGWQRPWQTDRQVRDTVDRILPVRGGNAGPDAGRGIENLVRAASGGWRTGLGPTA